MNTWMSNCYVLHQIWNDIYKYHMLVGPQYTQGLQDSGCKSNDPRLSRNSGFEISYERGSRAFCAPRWEYSTQCVSKLFPLSVVFSAVSPPALRSFLPMCFRVGSVLRLLLSVSRSLVWAAYASLLPSFKRLLRNSGFGWSSPNESRWSWSISSSIK